MLLQHLHSALELMMENDWASIYDFQVRRLWHVCEQAAHVSKKPHFLHKDIKDSAYIKRSMAFAVAKAAAIQFEDKSLQVRLVWIRFLFIYIYSDCLCLMLKCI